MKNATKRIIGLGLGLALCACSSATTPNVVDKNEIKELQGLNLYFKGGPLNKFLRVQNYINFEPPDGSSPYLTDQNFTPQTYADQTNISMYKFNPKTHIAPGEYEIMYENGKKFFDMSLVGVISDKDDQGEENRRETAIYAPKFLNLNMDFYNEFIENNWEPGTIVHQLRSRATTNHYDADIYPRFNDERSNGLYKVSAELLFKGIGTNQDKKIKIEIPVDLDSICPDGYFALLKKTLDGKEVVVVLNTCYPGKRK